MTAETAQQFAALEAQAQTLMSVFTKAGHEAVAPAFIQPADVFLDTIGEALRARTYVFTDPDGAELCLRPDLTLPTCRLHLARHANPATPARYCYNGPAFRFQAQGADAMHPREFRQAGIERFGDTSREAAEAETLALILKALGAAGLKNYAIRIGDLGLFRAVLAAGGLSPRHEKRLAQAFSRPKGFRAELHRLAAGQATQARNLPAELIKSLHDGDPEGNEARVAAYFEASNIELAGTRTLAEIATRLQELADETTSAPLDKSAAALIEGYIAISGPARACGEDISRLLENAKGGTGRALDAYDRRLAQLANAGVDVEAATFSAEFGRNLGYYTGLVFEITAPGFDSNSPIAGGGRYDELIRAAGAEADVPAVGAAIHTERLLTAIRGGVR